MHNRNYSGTWHGSFRLHGMDELPVVAQLYVVELDELIRGLWSLVRTLSAQVTDLQAKAVEL